MPTFQQPKSLNDLLLSEPISGLTKESVVLSGGNIEIGTVLGKLGSAYKPLAPGGGDSTETAAAVSAVAVDASVEDVPGVVIRRLAAVSLEQLVWPSGITEAQKATALAELGALHIVARTPL
jgi:hypothetical protein